MGCDIHLHAEVKIDYDKVIPGRASGEGEKMPLRWEHYAQISVPRSYTLFARMAGVRNYDGVEVMVEPRGLPEDISGVTLFDWMRGRVRGRADWHTPSWLNAKEISDLKNWCRENLSSSYRSGGILRHFDLEYESLSYLFGNSYAGLHDYPEETAQYRPGLMDVRFVFWFDN